MPDTDHPDAAAADDLFVVAPDRFVASRDALARRLRAAGEKADAARVGKMRRPPPTAWALNQVSRSPGPLIEQVLEAGRGLRAATERALHGDASGLRQARTVERGAVDAVVAEAVQRLEQGGPSAPEALRQRMAATLRAAIVDEAVADLLRRGTLAGDHDAPGFGMDALSGPAPGRPGTPAEDAPAPEGAPDDSAGAEAPAEETEDATAAGREEAAAEQARIEALLEAERLAGEADRLEAEADRLAGEADRARRRASEARQRADSARRAVAQRHAGTGR